MLVAMPARIHGEIHRSDRIGWLRAGGARRPGRHRLDREPAHRRGRREQRPHRAASSPASPRSSPARCRWRPVSTRRCRSQRDTELADIARETQELARYPEHRARGAHPDLRAPRARPAARPPGRDPAHARPTRSARHVRDELGIVPTTHRPARCRPRAVSAAGFAARRGARRCSSRSRSRAAPASRSSPSSALVLLAAARRRPARASAARRSAAPRRPAHRRRRDRDGGRRGHRRPASAPSSDRRARSALADATAAAERRGEVAVVVDVHAVEPEPAGHQRELGGQLLGDVGRRAPGPPRTRPAPGARDVGRGRP